MKPKILSKGSLIDDLKVQKSITRRLLRYFKSRSIIYVLCKYTFLKKVRGIYPAYAEICAAAPTWNFVPVEAEVYIVQLFGGGGGGGLKMVPFAIFGAENWYNMNSDHKKAKI